MKAGASMGRRGLGWCGGEVGYGCDQATCMKWFQNKENVLKNIK